MTQINGIESTILVDSTNTALGSAANPVNSAPTSLYPTGSTPLAASSGTVAASTAAATLAKAAAKTVYISGFSVTGSGATTALPVAVTVVGILGGTLTFTYTAVAGVLLANQPLVVAFNPPLPASGTNVDIVVSCPTLGSGATNNTVNAQGFRV